MMERRMLPPARFYSNTCSEVLIESISERIMNCADVAAGPPARLQDGNIVPAAFQFVRAGQTGDAGAHHNHGLLSGDACRPGASGEAKL
jgi:hypothetical protein